MLVGLAVLLPSTKELSKVLFLSSFVMALAINAALWGSLHTIQSYYALFIMGLNILLVAPITLSAANIFTETSKIETGYTICCGIFAAIQAISFVICVLNAIYFDGRSIASFRSVCRNYYAAMILLIIVSMLQFVNLSLVGLMIYRRIMALKASYARARTNAHKRPLFLSRQGILMLGALPYILAILTLVILERLNTFVQLTTENAKNGYNTLSFAQKFALATSVAPFIEVTKYMFRKTKRLGGRSPIWYMISATNFQLRT